MKKIRMNLLALGILATIITTSVPVFAATDTGTSNAGTLTSVQANTNIIKSKAKINANTVITDDNVNDVFRYLGLNPSDLIEGNKTGKSVGTVGELQKAIEQAKKQAKEQKFTVKTKAIPNKLSNAKITLADDDDDTPTSSQRVYSDLDCDNYTVEFSCSGQYRHGQWCGVSDEEAELTNSQQGFFSYAITSKNDLSAEYTSDAITMQHNITVTGYVGVGRVCYPASRVTLKGSDKFNIDDWV
jgi:hypothetical protein